MNIFASSFCFSVFSAVFETIPQGALQACLAFDIWKVADANISKIDVYWSIASAIANSLVQIIKLKLESRACHEKFLAYSLECLMARIGWIPFQKEITKILEKSQNMGFGIVGTQLFEKAINYNIKYDLPFNLSKCKFLCPCLYKYQASLDFDFSTLTIQLNKPVFFGFFFFVCAVCFLSCCV